MAEVYTDRTVFPVVALLRVTVAEPRLAPPLVFTVPLIVKAAGPTEQDPIFICKALSITFWTIRYAPAER